MRSKSFAIWLVLFFAPGCLSSMPSEGKVTYVYDGDTIQVNGKKIRLIGVDTPEVGWKKKNIPKECYGDQASKYMKGMLTNHKVFLKGDPLTPEKDRYDRFLAYVYLGSRLINADLIEKGYGFAMVRFPYSQKENFRNFQKKAQEEKLGLWKECQVNCHKGYCESGDL